MLERDGYLAGVPCWVDTAQLDPEAAVAFYGALFGWEFEDRMPADSPGRYFVARLRGRDVAAVGSQPDGVPPMPAWTTYIWVDSADDAAAKVAQAGGQIRTQPLDVVDAGRMAVVADPSGAVFCVWEAKKHRGAQLANEPGTWNWSDLHTRDLHSAKEFYQAVFGWEAAAADLGEGDYAMWKLPGYGDFLERGDPELRRRHAQDGVPEGFSDAVGWLVRMTSEEFPADVPPHWSVTFAVDDTDATVERAVALGGRVVTPPFDTPPVRAAVLADPEGAVFTVSTYNPDS